MGDLYELKLAERRHSVKLFLESLIHLPRELWRPTLVILDEAHIYCPERGSGEAESTEAVISLMSQGRKRGYAGVIATQRLSKLHKHATAEANNVIIGRMWYVGLLAIRFNSTSARESATIASLQRSVERLNNTLHPHLTKEQQSKLKTALGQTPPQEFASTLNELPQAQWKHKVGVLPAAKQNRRFALTRWWSRGNSNCRSSLCSVYSGKAWPGACHWRTTRSSIGVPVEG